MNLKNIFLRKIRLSYYLLAFIVIYLVASWLLPKVELTGAALTLFSVNSFLYGFYISPIIKSQNDRIAQLHKLIVSEVNRLREIYQYSYRTEPELRVLIGQHIICYAKTASVTNPGTGQAEFDEIVKTLITYQGEGKDAHKEMLKSIFAAQQNRAEIIYLSKARVFNNEWIVMLILFTITISFIMMIQLPPIPAIQVIPAILCAGLSMLIIILIKMSTMTHKRARSMWRPLKEFAEEKLDRI